MSYYGAICDMCKGKLNPITSSEKYCELCKSKLNQPDNHKSKNPMLYGVLVKNKENNKVVRYIDYSNGGLSVKHDKIKNTYHTTEYVLNNIESHMLTVMSRIDVDNFWVDCDMFRKSLMEESK